MKKILITGGKGFIARNVYEQLNKKYEIVSPDKKNLNLLDSQKVLEFLKENKFDVVIHTATYDAAPKDSDKDPSKVLENNLKMFFNLVRGEKYFGKMIYFGSGAEFNRESWIPNMGEDYFDENIPEDQYGLSKYIMTKYTLQSDKIYNLRLFAVFGKYENPKVRLISNLCHDIVSNLPMKINQNKYYDFMDVKDLVRIVEWFIENNPKKKIYNVCTGRKISFKEIAEEIKKIYMEEKKVIIKERGIGREYSGDNSLLLEELKDFKFTPIKDSIRDLYKWYAEKKDVRKLNYLLVMPRLIKKSGDGYSFPLGLPYISSVMKEKGYNVHTINLNHCDENIFEVLKKKIEENDIDVVATGGLSFQYNTIKEVIDSAKKIKSEIEIIVGGGIITADPEVAMEALENVDYGIVGEGEATIHELCKTLEEKGDLSNVEGIIYIKDGKYLKTSHRKEIENLDSLPWPDYEGFDFEKFLSTSPSISGINRKNTAFMIASRSCPYSCTFCFHTIGKRYRQRSLDNFFKELDYMVSKYNINYICLADELFSVDSERVKEFCERIKKYNLKWWAQFRVDQIAKNPEILSLLKESGCDVMSFGLESADNRILKSMGKRTTIKDAEIALKAVYESGIHLEGAFIFGDVEEDWETANNTLKWWKEHSEYKITLNLITIYPGTPLYHHACRNGIIKDKVKFLKESCPQVNVSKLTDEQISKIVKEIVESPITLTKTLEESNVEVTDFVKGRMKVWGRCSVCQKENYWEDVKFFSSSFLACNKCGQRYNLLLSKEIISNIDSNILKLIEKGEKVAVWGINYHVTNLFNKSNALRKEEVYPIDISNIKRLMDVNGKKINSPEIIYKEKIKKVIVAIPAYISEISGRIKKEYNNEVKVIDICELINPDYVK